MIQTVPSISRQDMIRCTLCGGAPCNRACPKGLNRKPARRRPKRISRLKRNRKPRSRPLKTVRRQRKSRRTPKRRPESSPRWRAC